MCKFWCALPSSLYSYPQGDQLSHSLVKQIKTIMLKEYTEYTKGNGNVTADLGWFLLHKYIFKRLIPYPGGICAGVEAINEPW